MKDRQHPLNGLTDDAIAVMSLDQLRTLVVQARDYEQCERVQRARTVSALTSALVGLDDSELDPD